MEKEQLQNKSDGESAKNKIKKNYSEKWWRKNIIKT